MIMNIRIECHETGHGVCRILTINNNGPDEYKLILDSADLDFLKTGIKILESADNISAEIVR